MAHEKPFRAELRFENQDREHFGIAGRFATKSAACRWLTREAVGKFKAMGEVTDIFDSIVFELWEDV